MLGRTHVGGVSGLAGRRCAGEGRVIRPVDAIPAIAETPIMASTIERLIEQMRSLQSELEAELAIRRVNLNYTLYSGRARFEQEVLRAHRALRINLARYIFNADL